MMQKLFLLLAVLGLIAVLAPDANQIQGPENLPLEEKEAAVSQEIPDESAASQEDAVGDSSAAESETAAAIDVNLPVLMYHTSSEETPGTWEELYVKPSEFEKQVAWLKDSGYTFCTFDDWPNLSQVTKPILLTFDDGYLENYTEIYPILEKYQAKATIFLVAEKTTGLTRDMIREMSGSSLVKFESHTLSHPSLVEISGDPDRLAAEIGDSKRLIEEITGQTVLALAYPNGEFNQQVKEITREYYLFGLRKDLGMHNTAYDDYEVHRIRINRSTSLDSFISSIN